MVSTVISRQTPACLINESPEPIDLIYVYSDRTYEFTKRVLDIVTAVGLLILMGPLMLLVAGIIRISSPGGALFRQLRAGQNGKPFVMYKFRTMRIDAEQARGAIEHLNEQVGPVFKVACDPRVTPLGRFLRRTSIDELPQMFNVLKGEMSIVGPRPLWLPEAEQAGMTGLVRTRVRPGLTCLWQISGRSELPYDRWVVLDMYYISNRSTLLDLMIMVQTIPAVLSTKGAY